MVNNMGKSLKLRKKNTKGNTIVSERRSEVSKGTVLDKLEMFYILIVALAAGISCQNSLNNKLKNG